MNDEDIRWLSYDELARVLRIAPDSARRLVARRKWPRKPGNDGRARIGVPTERLPPHSPPDVTSDKGDDVKADITPDSPPDVRDDITPVIRIMVDHIERLEKELMAVRAERDAECTRAAELAPKVAQVEALQAILEAEKRRADELCADRDRNRTHTNRLEGDL